MAGTGLPLARFALYPPCPMDGNPIYRTGASWRAACLSLAAAALVAYPATASTPAVLEDGITPAEFEQSFDALPVATTDVAPSAHAVDLDTFDAPIEPEPETTGQSLGTGIASYYGRKFHGRRTANGERFDMHGYTAAHKTLPFGTKLLVTNPRTGKSVTVRVNDRGPFTPGRTIDLSRAAAEDLGIVRAGHGRVELALLD